jgi:hypothetical protein
MTTTDLPMMSLTMVRLKVLPLQDLLHFNKYKIHLNDHYIGSVV